MKTSFISAIAAVVLSASIVFSASADDKDVKKVTGFSSGVYASKDGKIKINIDKYNHASTGITLFDATGKVIYHETMGKNSKQLRREIDANDLSYGNYTLEITSKDEKQVKTLRLTEVITERSIKMN